MAFRQAVSAGMLISWRKGMENKKLTVHMVPSTHWDREWYLPFRKYQVRLVRTMDKIISLLESGKDPYFVLDGQTIMIEDIWK